jgi:ABC-type anion transport system duplicated permease subunit
LTERVQPIAQFLAAFPANLLFPVAVFLIVHFELAPKIWLSSLMILGTQWYILFNVIGDASAFPSDFREAASSFRFAPGIGGAKSFFLEFFLITSPVPSLPPAARGMRASWRKP